MSTRERILAAAAAIIGEDGVAARLSVRAVAARAGVSTGSLRHHFPTQQVLRDEVMRRINDWILPERSIGDTSIPARDRLVGCLRQVLDSAGAGAEARRSMVLLIEAFVTVEQTEAIRAAYLSIQRDAQRRMEEWLEALAKEDEGLPVAEIARRARHLGTVLSGLALERALPAADSLVQIETDTLYAAADMALAPAPATAPGPEPGSSQDSAS